MVCKKCGNNIDDMFNFCGYCGAPVEAETTDEAPEQDSDAAPVRVYNKKRIVFLSVTITIALLVITAIVIFLCTDFIVGGSSYTTVIEMELEAIQDIDVKKHMEILPSDYIQYDLDTTDSYSSYDDMLLDYEDMLWQINRKNKKEYGSDFKIVYEIKEEGHCRNAKELSDLTEKFNKAYNGKSIISETVKAVVTTEIKSSTGSGNRVTGTIYFIKIDGKWYLDVDKLSETLDY